MKKLKQSENPFLKDDWTEESLAKTWEIISDLAKNKYGLTWYDPNFEVVNFEDMLHIYSGSLPITYDHWSFGKTYEEMYRAYSKDRMSIAYEVIFNTNPALCYLLEHNSPTMQGLTISHAAIGHSAFFKNNETFKEMTNASSIMSFLKKSRSYITECEVAYGADKVEKLLDACHSLSMYAIDRMPIKQKTNKEREKTRIQRMVNKEKDFDLSIEATKVKGPAAENKGPHYLREENILKFIGKFSPALKPWQREIITIYCKIQQYLYPQMQTKVMNEGFASFWHYTLMNDLSDLGILPPGGTFEFLHSHTSVLRQTEVGDKYYGGINPYKLGYEIFNDIKRICTDPTDEDKEWFPELIGQDWIKAVKFAAYNFKDDSFILQYLSPKVIRDLRMFNISDDCEEEKILVSDIHDDDGYKAIRKKLSESYSFSNRIPDIYVEGWDAKRSRTLFITYQERDRVEINVNEADKVFEYIKTLWPFPIVSKYIDSEGNEIEGGDGGGL